MNPNVAIIEAGELTGAEDGVIISNLAPEVIPESVEMSLSSDERDDIVTNEDGTTQMSKWIVPRKPSTLPLAPVYDRVREGIYQSYGNLTKLLEFMNWHDASKGELMRWIGKLNLSSDIVLARDTLVDKAEEIIRVALDEGSDVETAKFVVKTVGKRRGWSEREGKDAEQGGNVYNFINMYSSGSEDMKEFTDAGLVRYLEEQISER